MKLRMRPRTVISTTYRGRKDVITNFIYQYNVIGICTQIVPVQASNEDAKVCPIPRCPVVLLRGWR